MFKDLYKQANDKIDISDPKSRVMARLSQSSLPARKSYRAAKVAALAACFILTIAAAGIYENIQKETETLPGMIPEMSVVENGETDKPAVSVASAPVPEASAAPTQAPAEKKTAAPKSEAVQPDIKNEVSEKAAANCETVVPEVLADYAEETTEDSVAAQLKEKAEEENKVSGGGGSSAKMASALVINEANSETSGASMARFAIPAKEERYVSVQEYCEEIGKNIPLVVDLPEGVKDQTIPVQPMWAGEDKFTFTFMGNEKMVQLEATRNIDSVQMVIDNPAYEKSRIENNDAVVLAENEILTAYLVSDSVGYTVMTINCTEIELENLLVSLN